MSTAQVLWLVYVAVAAFAYFFGSVEANGCELPHGWPRVALALSWPVVVGLALVVGVTLLAVLFLIVALHFASGGKYGNVAIITRLGRQLYPRSR